MKRRLLKIGGGLLVLFIALGLIFQKHSIFEILEMLMSVFIVALLIWYELIGENRIDEKKMAKDFERIKKYFSLKEGELVEVLFSPSDKAFQTRLFFKIQDQAHIRYFALLQGNEISIVLQVNDNLMEPEKLDSPAILEQEFMPKK